MAMKIERKSNGEIIYKASDYVDVPNLDLLTLLFDSNYSLATEDSVLHVSCANPSISLNRRQLRDLSQRTAHVLRNQYGIGKNGPNEDVVSVISSGTLFLPLLFYSVVAADGVFSAASATSTPSDLARQIGIGRSKVLVCNEESKDVAIKAASMAGLDASKVLIMNSETLGWGLSEVLTSYPISIGSQKLIWKKRTNRKELEDSLICLIYSSGTTGLPKGVRLSHSNLVSEVVVTHEPWKAYNRVNRPDFEYRSLAHLPIAHIAGILGYLINPFYMGGTLHWMPKFNFQDFLAYNRKYRITLFFTVPPIYLLIAKSPEVMDHFDSLEIAISGAAPMGKDLQMAAQEKLGKGETKITQTWGLSETTGSITLMPRGQFDDTGSVSMLVANSLARIVDDDGKDVELGERGEIWVKSPVVTTGYHNNPEANSESFRDGWFCTGDIALYKDGMFYIVDRKKELIKYKGLQVAPAELEALLISHPDILDAAVIGVEAEGTEVPRAYVVADRNKVPSEKIQKFVQDNVSDYKRLRGGVVFMDVIPKSPAGKILRKDLRELAKRERGAKL